MYYISSGFGNGMYTLREHNYIPTNYGFNEKDSYIRNLSRDFDKAITKAKEYVGDRDKLEVGNKFDLEKWGEAEKPYRWEAPVLTPEEIAKREAEAMAQAKKEAEEEAEYQEVLRLRQEAYDKADPVPVTDDRIKFTGVIEKTYHKDNQWGGQWRMFFIDDRGFKLNGASITSPAKDITEGSRVSFVATVTPSFDDPKFGFFKRPNQVEIL